MYSTVASASYGKPERYRTSFDHFIWIHIIEMFFSIAKTNCKHARRSLLNLNPNKAQLKLRQISPDTQ